MNSSTASDAAFKAARHSHTAVNLAAAVEPSDRLSKDSDAAVHITPAAGSPYGLGEHTYAAIDESFALKSPTTVPLSGPS